MSLKSYVQKYLSNEYEEIQRSQIRMFHLELSLYEKAIIYKYSGDGYIEINQKLLSNKGKNTSVFGKLLVQALAKLANYTSTVYRKVELTKAQQNKYKKACINDTHVKESAFSSTSKVRELAMLFQGNTLFVIKSKTGKDIEKIAKFGYNHRNNEYEVLFLPGRTFEVLEVDESEQGLLIITMEEI